MQERAGNLAAMFIGFVFLGCIPMSWAETVLITGSNSGIGLAFAEHYAGMGWKVIATHRRDHVPQTLQTLQEKYANVQVEHMDVTNNSDIDALAEKLRDVPIDVLINNAGTFYIGERSDPGTIAAQQFGTLDYEQFDTFMHTHVRGPLKIAEAFLPNVRASQHGKIINMSSNAGSLSLPIAAMRAGYWYKVSKAALNMSMKILAYDMRKYGIIVVMLYPGEVRSAYMKDLNLPGLMEPAQSVASMAKLIGNLTLADSGRFLNYEGKPQPF